jgi:hypothetical protein
MLRVVLGRSGRIEEFVKKIFEFRIFAPDDPWVYWVEVATGRVLGRMPRKELERIVKGGGKNG